MEGALLVLVLTFEWVHMGSALRCRLLIEKLTVVLVASRCEQLLSVLTNLGCIVVANVEDERLDLAGVVPAAAVNLLDEVALALDAPVGNLADLFRVERFPRLVVKVFVEGHDENGIDKVDERVPDVAHVVQVQRQIKVVVAAIVVPVDALQKHLLRVLVWDVPDHDRRTLVFTTQYAIKIDHELGILVHLARILLILHA